MPFLLLVDIVCAFLTEWAMVLKVESISVCSFALFSLFDSG